MDPGDSNQFMENLMRRELIFNAVEGGWTVTKLDAQRYKFEKSHDQRIHEITPLLPESVTSFLQTYLGHFFRAA